MFGLNPLGGQRSVFSACGGEVWQERPLSADSPDDPRALSRALQPRTGSPVTHTHVLRDHGQLSSTHIHVHPYSAVACGVPNISVLPRLAKRNLPAGDQRKNNPPMWNRSLGNPIIRNLAPYITLKAYVHEVLVLNLFQQHTFLRQLLKSTFKFLEYLYVTEI